MGDKYYRTFCSSCNIVRVHADGECLGCKVPEVVTDLVTLEEYDDGSVKLTLNLPTTENEKPTVFYHVTRKELDEIQASINAWFQDLEPDGAA